jgi:GDPmannose 4,6-dehydratase
VDALQADYSKARTVLGWEPTVSFKRLVHMMVDADIHDLERTIKGGRAALRTVGERDL